MTSLFITISWCHDSQAQMAIRFDSQSHRRWTHVLPAPVVACLIAEIGDHGRVWRGIRLESGRRKRASFNPSEQWGHSEIRKIRPDPALQTPTQLFGSLTSTASPTTKHNRAPNLRYAWRFSYQEAENRTIRQNGISTRTIRGFYDPLQREMERLYEGKGMTTPLNVQVYPGTCWLSMSQSSLDELATMCQ